MIVLCDVAIVEVLDAEIIKNQHQIRAIEYRKIQTVLFGADNVVHAQIYTKYKNGFYQQIDTDQNEEID